MSDIVVRSFARKFYGGQGGAPRVMLSTYSDYEVLFELMIFDIGDSILCCYFCNNWVFVYFAINSQV